MITADYFIHEPSAEWEAVERWENEGGRLRQHYGHSLDSMGENYRRRMEQANPNGRIADRMILPAQRFLLPTRLTI